MSDSETLLEPIKISKKQRIEKTAEISDFPSMGVDLLKKVNFKVAFFLAIFGIFLLSDIFIEKFLPNKYKDDTGTPNTSGTVVQLVILILFYMIIDILVQGSIL